MRIRTVTLDDADVLLAWRNDPATRAASRSTESVDTDEHRRWLTTMLERPDALLMIAEDDGEPVGHVRFVGSDGSAEVSIVIAPEHRGKGLGRSMLIAAHQQFRRTSPGVRVRAYVRAENQPSHAMFRAAGYVVASTDTYGSWYEGGPDA